MPENADLIIMVYVVLYNYLTEQWDLPALYNTLNPDSIPYLADNGAILDVPNLHVYDTLAQAKAIRDIYQMYFNHPEGALPWQHRATIN